VGGGKGSCSSDECDTHMPCVWCLCDQRASPRATTRVAPPPPDDDFFFVFPAALPVIVRTVLYVCLQSRTSTSPFLALEIFKFRTQHPQQLHKHQQEPTALLCIGGAGGGPGERVVLLCNWERFEGRDDKDAA
jgi:hypothetical protein